MLIAINIIKLINLILKKSLENELVLKNTPLSKYDQIFDYSTLEEFKSENLFDYIIKENIETHIFDFEGGELPNIEEFFRGFRPELRPYGIIENSKKNHYLN